MDFYYKYLKYKKKYLLLKDESNIKYTSIPTNTYDGISALAHTNHYNNRYNHKTSSGGALERLHNSWCWQ